MKHLFCIAITLILLSCTTTKKTSTKPTSRDEYTFLLTEVSTDATYGLSAKNPVQTGEGPSGERKYLNALAGPNGEKITYYRAGSCCPVKSKNGLMGMAMLDNYRVTWEGGKDTVSIYINMYDYAELKAPVGFTIKE